MMDATLDRRSKVTSLQYRSYIFKISSTRSLSNSSQFVVAVPTGLSWLLIAGGLFKCGFSPTACLSDLHPSAAFGNETFAQPPTRTYSQGRPGSLP